MRDDFDPFAAEPPPGAADGLATVDLEFGSLRRFREEMAPYLGDRGFFARSERPLPRHTPVRFRFMLPGEFVLAEGTATVAWTIDPEANPELIPGMALRFVHVGSQSRAVIRELVDFHIATGGDPFDPGPGASGPAEIPTDALEGAPDEPGEDLAAAPPERDAAAPAAPAPGLDEILPDWLRASVSGEREGGALPFADDLRAPQQSQPGAVPPGGFEIDLVVDDREAGPEPPSAAPWESIREAAARPRPSADPAPRDLRLGLMVAAALAVVAVAVLVWSLWFRSREPEGGVAHPAPAAPTAPEPVVVATGVAEPAAQEPQEPPTKIFVSEASPPEALPPQPTALPRPTAAAPEPQRPAAPATRVVEVSASVQVGITSVLIRGNGSFSDAAVGIVPLADPPRIWVRVRGIESFYRPSQIEVGSPEVLRVRIGHHPEERPPALYVVVDLADSGMKVTGREIAGDTIRLRVGRR
ncbi:MAG: hypothetical protein MUE90_03565 [Thermoanaerobaculales bacterium]|jgi:hypothetical protein|nr:hypothetical protein [Thermoanaerobaculales bacterium]